MANTANVPAKKSHKTGLLVAIILLVVAIATGVAAAIILLNPFGKTDAVPAAISKLMSGQLPEYVSMTGTVNVSTTSESSMFSSLSVDFSGGIKNRSGESFTNAKVLAGLVGGGEFDFNVDEIYTADGALYLKMSNVYHELGDYYFAPLSEQNNGLTAETTETNCTTVNGVENCIESREVMEIDCIGSEGTDNCAMVEPILIEPTTEAETETEGTKSLYDYLGVFDVIEDEWIRIPESSFNSVSSITTISNMPTQCLIDAAGKLGQYGSDFANKYKEYPFINYSTENPGIVKRANDLYRLTFDSDKLAKFINSMSNSGFMNELLACTGGQATNASVDAAALTQVIAALPTIYVEIDDNDNFTRLYLSVTTPDGLTTATADFSLSYPSSLTIKEPSEYIDINQALSDIFTKFYGQPVFQEDYVDYVLENM